MRTLLSARSRSTLYLEQGPSGLSVLKVLATATPSPREVIALDNELEITRTLELTGIRRALRRDRVEGRHALVLAYVDGEPLSSWVGKLGSSLDRFLRIAVQISRVLTSLHERGVIHKDIKPANILYEPTTGQVTLIDFGISSRVDVHALEAAPADLEGTLAYMAPEQTGRLHRPIDARSDLYALGATFYELITGSVPFATTDPSELVHAHLAKPPRPPIALVPSIPSVLSSLVLRLMAKDPEDRYQTSLGLTLDLERALAGFDDAGRIESFVLGADDVSRRLQVPGRLYGRDPEVKLLESVLLGLQDGENAFVLIAGYSGVGKSSLVHEIGSSVASRRGWFASGKFELLGGEPHHALLQALRGVTTSLLSGAQDELETMAHRMRSELEGQGQVLIELIPAFERVIGAQPAVPEIAAAEAQHRLTFVLRAFVRSVARESRPLVLFLDDLQWADRAALELIASLVTDRTPGLLLVGAYRDNEVDATHPLVALLDEIHERGVVPLRIHLRELGAKAVEELVAETLRSTTERVARLATMVREKTGGNAFFIRQFLSSLHEAGELRFDTAALTWRWDERVIREHHVTDNVADLVTRKLAPLAPETRRTLGAAACLGADVDLAQVAAVLDVSLREVVHALWPAVEGGLLLAIGDAYRLSVAEDLSSLASSRLRFVHDRVQHDAARMLSDDDRAALHLRAGTLWREGEFGSIAGSRSAGGALADTSLYAVVRHLNQALRLIVDPAARLDLAALNLDAGRRAIRAAAHGHAYAYLTAGLATLPPSSSAQSSTPAGSAPSLERSALVSNRDERVVRMATELHTEGASAAYLLGDLDAAIRHAVAVLEGTSDPLLRAPAFTTLLLAAQARGDLSRAIDHGSDAVRGLGIELPRAPGMHHIGAALAGVKVSLLGRRIESLLDLKRMNDPSLEAAMVLLERMIPAAFRSGSKLFPLLVLKIVSTSLRHGNTPVSCFGYAAYAITLAGVLGDLEGGYRFGKLAMALTDRLGAEAFRPKVLFVYGNFVRHWREPLIRSTETLFDAYRTGLATGSVFEALWAAVYRAYWMFCAGVELGEVEAQLDAIGDLVRHDATGRTTAALLRQAVANLRGESVSTLVLTGAHYDEAEARPRLEKASDKIESCAFHILKCRLYLMDGEVSEAMTHADLAERYFEAITAMPFVRELHFYGTLARIQARLDDVRGARSDGEISRKITRSRKLLETWSQHEPGSAYRLALVDAEIARLEGRMGAARDGYEQAIAGARTSGMIHDEAYTCERAAQIHAGHPVLEPALQEAAMRAWRQWGARPRVEHLASSASPISGPSSVPPRDSASLLSTTRLGRMVSTTPGTTQATTPVSVSTGSRGSSVLDLSSALKAAAAISAELNMDRLLASLLKIVLENAGAVRGALVLSDADELVVHAESNGDGEVRVLEGTPLGQAASVCESIVRYVSRTEQELVLSDASQDPRFASSVRSMGRPIRSVLCAPIRHQGRRLGVIYLENDLAPGVFTADRLQLLSLLTSQAAIALENARLVSHLDATVAQRTSELNTSNGELRASLDLLATELADAAAYVRSLLPSPLRSPEISWRFTPSAHLGGDAFGYHWVAPGQLAIYLLDVAGHGIASALHSVAALTALQSQRLPGVDFHDPAAVMAALNRAFPREQSNGLYLTAWYGVLDTTTLLLRHVSAGHPPPVVVRGDQHRELDAVGPMVGVIPDLDYDTECSQLAIGERLFVFSDGVYEIARADGTMLPYELFLDELVRHGGADAKLDAMEAFARHAHGRASLEDDFSMLLVQL